MRRSAGFAVLLGIGFSAVVAPAESKAAPADQATAAARGLVDAIITPEDVREALILALETCQNTTTPHIGAFVLPQL